MYVILKFNTEFLNKKIRRKKNHYLPYVSNLAGSFLKGNIGQDTNICTWTQEWAEVGQVWNEELYKKNNHVLVQKIRDEHGLLSAKSILED